MGFVNRDFINSFLTAGIACSISQTVTAPVDRVKLLLQLQHSAIRKEQVGRPYKGMIDCFVRVVKEQGFFAMWRGNLPNVIRCFPYQALNFAFKDRFQRIFVSRVAESNKVGRAIASIASGGFSGLFALSVVYPLDLIRTRMAMNLAHQLERGSMSSFVNTIRSTVKHDGILGLYRGFPFSMSGVFLYRASFFGIYDTVKIMTPESHRNVYTALVAAEVAAISAGLTAYPFDTVRRNMMMQTMNNLEFKNSRECVRYIYNREGLKGFYHGGTVNVFRATGAALMLVLYDEIQQVFFGLNVFTKLAPPKKIQRMENYLHVEHMGCTGPDDDDDQEEEQQEEEQTMQEASIVPMPSNTSEFAAEKLITEKNLEFLKPKFDILSLVSDIF